MSQGPAGKGGGPRLSLAAAGVSFSPWETTLGED
jgi:hypothetical protein